MLLLYLWEYVIGVGLLVKFVAASDKEDSVGGFMVLAEERSRNGSIFTR